MNRRLLWGTFAFLAGILARGQWGYTGIALALFVLALAFLLRGRGRQQGGALMLAVLAVLFAAGSWRAGHEEAGIDRLFAQYGGKQVRITGVVSDVPVVYAESGKTRLLLRCMSMEADGAIRPCSATLWAALDGIRGRRLDYGDVIAFQGVLSRPAAGDYPGDFDSDTFLRAKRVHAQVYAATDEVEILGVTRSLGGVFLGVRRWMLDTVGRDVSGLEGELVKGVFLGERGGFTNAMDRDFMRSGTTHVVVVSGMHVSVLIMLIVLFCRAVGAGRRVSGIVGLAAIFCLIMITGLQPSILRAAFMGAVYLLGTILFKRADALTSLGLSLLLMSLYNPFVLYDVGLQLSFGATLGILLFSERIAARLTFLPAFFRDAGGVCLSAQLFTIPMIMWYFNSVSVVSLLANVVIVPYIDMIFLCSLLLLAVAPFPFLGYAVGALLKGMSAVVLYAAHGFAEMEFAFFFVERPQWWILGLYAAVCALGLLAVYGVRRRGAYCFAAGALAAFVLCGAGLTAAERGVVSVEMVGTMGQSFAYVESGEFNGMLLCGGSSVRKNCGAVLSAYVNRQGRFSLDVLVLNELSSQIGENLPSILDNIKVKTVYAPQLGAGGREADLLLQALKGRDVALVYLRREAAVQLAPDVALLASAPGGTLGRNSVNLYLEVRGRRLGIYPDAPLHRGGSGYEPPFCDVAYGQTAAALRHAGARLGVTTARSWALLPDGVTELLSLVDTGSVAVRIQRSGALDWTIHRLALEREEVNAYEAKGGYERTGAAETAD